MRKRLYKRCLGVLFLIVTGLPVYAQYTVTGGEGTPMMAKEEGRLKVYLLNGMDQVEIRYSSSSASHQWFRYKTNALNSSEAISSTQEGTTSFISNPEEGYGYYVAETENVAMNNFIWLIDYSRYAFDVSDIRVEETDTKCDGLFLAGNVNMPRMTYNLPNGNTVELKRELDVSYTTMMKNTDEKHFVLRDTVIHPYGNPFDEFYPAPLADTDFTIKGDQFARHFNIEKQAKTEMYQAIAIGLGADTTVLSVESGNVIPGGSSYSAPVDIRFSGYGNTPVATRFNWKIQHTEDASDGINYAGEEVEFTFRKFGKYTAKLEVSSAYCEDSITFEINIRESDLQVPNFFSPGVSPGMNDEFKVAYKSLVSFKGWIFNRWGVELFHWTDPAKGWDGKKGGKYVPPGVYFYVIEAKGSDGENYKKKGHINIIRPKNGQDQIIEQETNQ